MKEDHEPGRCHCCHEDTQIRWKNIYHMGSEGLWVCMPCELMIVNFVRRLSLDATRKKIELYKQPHGEDGRCIHCGAGDDIHHSFTCPTGLHPDSPSSKQPQCICGEINSRNCPVHQ